MKTSSKRPKHKSKQDSAVYWKKILPQNKQALQDRFPETWRRITRVPNVDTPLVNCWPNFQLTISNRTVHPYGETDCDALLQLWQAHFSIAPETLYGITGFGDGSHIQHVLNHCSATTYVFVAEPDVNVLSQVLAQKDCSSLLKDKRLLLAVGEPDQNFYKIMGDVPFSEVKSAFPMIYAPLHALNESYYANYLASLAQAIEVYKVNHHSSIRSSGYHQEQIIRNLPTLIHAPDIAATRNCFQGVPLILVGAGPSLDLSIDFLKQVQGHAIIASVNSSFRKLINSGIQPAITAAADPREDTFNGYARSNTAGVFLFCSHFVNPKVVQTFAGRTFTWALNQQIVSTLRSRLGLSPPTPVVELGTISSCVVDLARLWGCPKVCLVGQDFAVTEDGTTHTEDSFYADRGHNVMDTAHCRPYPGNTRTTVLVENRLLSYLKAFEQLVEDIPELTFINTSSIGAQVKGIPYMDYSAALEWLGDELTFDPRAKLATIMAEHSANSAIGAREFIKSIDPSKQFAQKLLSMSLEAAIFHETLPESYRNSSYAHNPKIKQARNYADAVNRFIDQHPTEYQIFFDGEGKRNLIHYTDAKLKITAAEAHWESILHNKEFFWALAEGAFFMHKQLHTLEHSLTHLTH